MNEKDFILRASSLKTNQLNKLVDNPSIYGGSLNTPQFPGKQIAPGMSVQSIRNWIKRQKRIKGYEFSNSVGANQYNINISGNAKIFLGLAYRNFSGTISDELSLTINNETIIDSVDPTFLGANFTDEEYYFIPRPLNGTDSIILTLTNAVAGVDRMVIYYI